MFKNNIKIAWRSMIKDRRFTLLNLLGLATGLACTFLIYMWVADEIGIDKFQANSSRLYQVMQNGEEGDGNIFTTEHTPDLLAKTLLAEVPEIQDAAVVRLPYWDEPSGIMSFNNNSFKAKEIYATKNFFTIFSFPLIQGNKSTVLNNKTNVLVSEEMAMKLFSTTNVVGKTITWDKGAGAPKGINSPYIVSGVFKVPASSSMKFDVVFTHEMYFSTITHDISWFSSDPSTYILLKKGVNAERLNNRLADFIKARYKDGSQEQKWAGTLFIQKYTDEYLHNRYENGKISGGRISYVELFSAIAIFILIIACINFMNLSTAKAAGRMKEVGVKKVVGATRAMLAWQYISESMLMAFLSLIIAMVLVITLLPAFRQITGKQLSLEVDAGFMPGIIAITIITGLLAGSYPALYLSKFKPVMVLKGRLQTSSGESWVRKGLVVFQFAISAVLIIAVIVVYNQMQLVQTKNLGYNRDNVIHFNNSGSIGANEKTFIEEIKTIPGVVNATNMEGDLLGNHSGGGGITWPGKTERIEFSGTYADFDFVETMGLQMKEGRAFDRKFPTDTAGVIFNETAVKMMHLKNPIGTQVQLWGLKQHIIGVVKDFNYESMYNKVGAYFISYAKNTENIVVKIKGGTEKQTLSRIEALYKKYNPGLPFDYRFMDADYQALYASEQRVAILSRYFAGVAIIISCLGLFGLAAFTAQKRQKEIGIRKIIGASVKGIAVMLSADFLKLVLVAILVAFPLAWWAMNTWLQSFAYHTSIGATVFVITGVSITGITLATISFQAIKAAMVNPVKSLRSE
ncbi:MAG TPA: ABC transporter permease [Chitinophagaceae bacterium]|nr:ABC transporter permease [Chitinophagaceae bacterium]